MFFCYLGKLELSVTLRRVKAMYRYDKNLNRYASLDRDEHYETDYSDYFNDWNWRKSKAVIGYLNSYIYKDSVGDAEYEYGTKIIIRHRHNF